MTLAQRIGVYSALLGLAVGGTTVWGFLGLPTPALSSDIERVVDQVMSLDRRDTAAMIQQYEDRLDRYILRRAELQSSGAQPFNPELQALNRQIDRTQRDLDAASAHLQALGQ